MAISKLNFINFTEKRTLLAYILKSIRYLNVYIKRRILSNLLHELGSNAYIHPSVTVNWPEKIKIGDNVKIYKDVFINCRTDENIGIELCDNVSIHEYSCIDPYGGSIKLNNHVGIGHHCVIGGHGGLEIGEYSMIAGLTYIVPANYVTTKIDIPYQKQGEICKGIKIGKNVWVGGNCIITDGVTISDNAIIGAGSVVTKNIPANCLAVGVPAKVIKELD